jgi:hypothetical protein
MTDHYRVDADSLYGPDRRSNTQRRADEARIDALIAETDAVIRRRRAEDSAIAAMPGLSAQQRAARLADVVARRRAVAHAGVPVSQRSIAGPAATSTPGLAGATDDLRRKMAALRASAPPRPDRQWADDAQLAPLGLARHAVVDAADIGSETRALTQAAIVDATRELGFLRLAQRRLIWFTALTSAAKDTVVGPMDATGFTNTAAGQERVLHIRAGQQLPDTIETAVHELVHSFQAEFQGAVQNEYDRADREFRADRFATDFRCRWAARH